MRCSTVLCNYCGYPVDAKSVSECERLGWCPNCRRVFRAPLFRMPGWVAGVILVLLIKLQAGL